MVRFKLLIVSFFVSVAASSQIITAKVDSVVQWMLHDSSMKHAITALYVVNSATNEVVYDLNSQVGLAPASCQKIITSIAALDLLGKDYKWKTELGYDGIIKNDSLKGPLYVVGYGDPTTGSWRYANTKENILLDKWVDEIKKLGIKYTPAIFGYDRKWESATIPGGWIWDDMGNYYGAGVSALNWKENQYELKLQAGDTIGAKVKVDIPEASLGELYLENELITGKNKTGDNAYVYLSPYSYSGYIRGSIGLDDTHLSIAAAVPNPSMHMVQVLAGAMEKAGMKKSQFVGSFNSPLIEKKNSPIKYTTFYTHYSPILDSVNYHFLRRSVNLYGEAFLKTIAYEKTGFGNTDSGLAIVRRYWQERGIEQSALHIKDGSGLSPQNRITANSLVTALQYAKQQGWFSSFYEALPTYNQMKLKSGTIGGAKSFAGYHKAKDGTEYTIAIIVNNFDGAASSVVNKMFKVLDELK
jgi:D-alanyl-D-alanine carboxypeptidase/D-alanyl-D-alanine-endopeptidase (penicillin-binding protein 4)